MGCSVFSPKSFIYYSGESESDSILQQNLFEPENHGSVQWRNPVIYNTLYCKEAQR